MYVNIYCIWGSFLAKDIEREIKRDIEIENEMNIQRKEEKMRNLER